VRLEALELPLRQALAAASKLGADGVCIDAVGDLSPRTLSQTGRREFRNVLRSHNLELSALACPPRRALGTPEDQGPRLDKVGQVMILAADLGPRRVVVQAGPVPEEPDSPVGRVMAESLINLGRHGDRVGCVLALETGLESGEVLAAYLSRFDTGS